MELEELEFSKRMAALSPAEQKIAAEHISSDILFDVLKSRQEKQQELIGAIESILRRYVAE